MLETEITNKGALNLYEKLGFVRDKRLSRYYLNDNDAFRLKLWFKAPSWGEEDMKTDSNKKQDNSDTTNRTDA